MHESKGDLSAKAWLANQKAINAPKHSRGGMHQSMAEVVSEYLWTEYLLNIEHARILSSVVVHRVQVNPGLRGEEGTGKLAGGHF